MRVNIGVIGAGRWGPHLARNFAEHPDSELAWIADTDPVRRKALAMRFPRAQVVADFGDVIGDPGIDAVAVATPTSTHYDIVKAALQAGKHVLVEKPLTDNLATALELAETAEAQGVHLMVGHVFLFNSAVIAAKEQIDAGDLGEIRYISMERTNLGPVRSDVNAAWDLASHDISVANYFLESVPLVVTARGGDWLAPGVEDVVFTTLTYPGDVLVHIMASWLNPLKRRFISVVGDRRMLTVDDMNITEPLRVYDKGVDTSSIVTDTFAGFRAQVREGSVTIPSITAGEPLRNECDSFVRRLLGEDISVSDGEAGVDVVRVLEAIDRSLRQHGVEVEVAL